MADKEQTGEIETTEVREACLGKLNVDREDERGRGNGKGCERFLCLQLGLIVAEDEDDPHKDKENEY